MNNQRRKKLKMVLGMLDNLFAAPINIGNINVSIIKNIITEVEYCRDEEEMAYDNMPETLRYSAKCDEMEQNVSDLYDVSNDLESILEYAEDTCSASKPCTFEPVKSACNNVVNLLTNIISR